MYRNLFLVIVGIKLCFMFPVYGQSEKERWKIVKDKEGIILYEKDSVSSSLKFYKGEMIISAQLKTLENFIKDIENYQNWMTSVDSGQYLTKFSDSTFIYRVVMEIPVLKNMEAIGQFELCKNKNGMDIITNSISLPDYIEPNPNFKRIEKFTTSWQFREISANRIKVNYEGMVDTYSNFIYFLIGRTIINDLYESFDGLRNHNSLNKP